MGSRKIVMLVGSILVGVVAGLALLSYVNGVEADVTQGETKVEVFVVARDIAAGTPAVEVQQTGGIEVRKITADIRPANAVTDLSQISGRISANNLAANQVLVVGMFDDPEVINTTFSDLVPEGQIAVTINVPKARAVAGFIEPGDFVDVIVLGDQFATIGDDSAFDTAATQTPYSRPARFLYRGVRIVAIGSDIVGTSDDTDLPESEAPSEVTSFTVAVPAESAQRLLSVPEANLVLGLLPDGWTPEAQPNVVLEDILIDAELPGEDGNFVTPYGRDGFVGAFEDAASDDAAGEAADVDEAGTDQATTEGDG